MGLDALLAYAAAELAKPEEEEVEPVSKEPHRFVIELEFEIVKLEDGWRVTGSKVERLAAMATNFHAGRRDTTVSKYSS